MNKKPAVETIALFLALLFHVSGLIGILFTPYKNWFAANTPITLLLMAVLIVFTHPSPNKKFFLFFIVAFMAGFFAEVIGVHTGLLFGNYNYGNILGLKVFNVPLIIGINWFTVIYCTGTITQAYENFMMKKINSNGILISKGMMVDFVYN